MATQKGRNWSSGDIVTAANLNSIERGVSAVAEEYTPTTWANGNTVTAAGLNNIEQGIANAGGGSGDFSTATLSIVDGDGFTVNLDFATLNERGFSLGGCSEWNGTDDLTVILYKGKAILELENLNSANITVSGAIENVGGNIYVITGDCTITISGSSGEQILE